MSTESPSVAFLRARQRWHWAEVLPWLIAIAVFFALPGWLAFGTQVLVAILFALSLDLILGYAGIVTLGHAAFFGTGAYTVAMLAKHAGWTEPISGLIAAALAAALLGLISGMVILRTHGLTLLMLTLALGILMYELANALAPWTGGFDGVGFTPQPILGLFEFDLWFKVPYLYALAVLFLMFLMVRRIVYSPFGKELEGIRENVKRMHAIGAPVTRRLVTVYAISAAIAGVAGGVFAQANAYVTLEVLSFPRSGAILIMLILGGSGRLYGAFVGVAIYMLIEHKLANEFPAYWEMGIGLLLVLTVLFARRGLLGIAENIGRRLSGGSR